MEELEQLTEIISVILGKDNFARKQNEAMLRELQLKNINQYIYVFVNLLNVSPSKEIRIFCALHLRRRLSSYTDEPSEWPHLASETQTVVKDLLIDTLMKETQTACRKILCDLIGELVATIKCMSKEEKQKCSEEGRQWDSINEQIWKFLASGDIVLIENGLKILGVLFRYRYEDYVGHKEEIFNILKEALEQENLRIKIRAVECLSEYVENVPFKDCKIFIDLVPLLLQNVLLVIDANEDLGVDMLASVTDMIEIEPKIFRPHFNDVFEVLKNISQNKSITIPALRESALETLVLFVQKSPKAAGKQEELPKRIYEAIFSYMVTCPEDVDEEWLVPPEVFVSNKYENESHEFSIKYCMDLFNRIIACLGQETTLLPLATMLQQLVETNHWRYKYSALMALSQIGEFIAEIAEMDPLVTFNLSFLKDENPKVRYAALHCIGQLSDDKRYDYQLRYYESIMPAFVDSFNEEVPRVLSHSLAALTNFLEGCSKRCVEGWIDKILEPCLEFINTGTLLVKENAISVIAALAVAAKQDFIPYWERTAEIIFEVIKNVGERKYKQLRSQAIECVTLMGDAVGKEEFRKAAPKVVEAMINIQMNDVEDVDPQKAYLLSGWQRLSNLFKQEFSPYLKEILPTLFVFIDQIIANYEKKRQARKNNEEEDDYEGEGEQGDNQKTMFSGANTSESDEVSLAVKMICTFLSQSWEAYLPYVDQTSKILLHLLTKSKNDEVRIACAKALPEVIKVLKSSNEPNRDEVISMTNSVYINVLWQAYLDEMDLGCMMTFVSSMYGIIDQTGRFLEPRQIEALNQNIINALRESDQRKQSNVEMLQEDEGEADEDQVLAMEEENEKEDELHCVLADLIVTLFKTHQELTVEIARFMIQKILPNALKNESGSRIHKFGVILVKGMVEHLGIELMKTEMPLLVQILLKFAVHKHPEVRDIANAGIGVIAERFEGNFAEIAGLCVKAVSDAMIMQPRKEEDKRLYWRTRARTIVTLGKIIKFQSQNIDVKQLVKLWSINLPIAYLIDEAKPQHEMLVDIVLELDPSLVFGENGERIENFLKIFAHLYGTKLIYETFIPKARKIISNLEENEGTKPLLEEAIGRLNDDLKEKLNKAMTT